MQIFRSFEASEGMYAPDSLGGIQAAHVFLWILLTLALALHGAAGPQLGNESPRYSVRGMIVNSQTGEAVRGALVQFYAERQRFQLTGPNGEFLFDDIPAGQFSVDVEKPGFFSSRNLPAFRGRLPMISVGADQPPAILKLIPEGIIYGRVSGENGEPLENVPVQLFSDHIENGRKSLRSSAGANTNDRGEFRLPELLPGRYFLFVGPAQPSSFSEGQRVEGYAPVFYPGGSDLAAAAPIDIVPGQHEELNVVLAKQPLFRLSGTVSGCAPEEGVSMQFLNASGQPISGGFEFHPSTGAFRSNWIPKGPINITAFCQDNKTMQTYGASQTMNVTSDRAGIRLMLLPSLTIPVSIRLEKTRDDYVQQTHIFDGFHAGSPTQEQILANVALIPNELASFRGQYNSEPLGTTENRLFRIRNIQPGTYSVEIYPNGPYYVQSAHAGSSDVREDGLTISPGASVQAINIVLRDDGGAVSGTVSSNGKPAEAWVAVVPISNPGPVQMNMTYNGGTFQFANLAPGRYGVLALDRAEDWEYRNPVVLRKYLSGASEITIGPNQSSRMELELRTTEEQAYGQ
jgi:hypothetical protein